MSDGLTAALESAMAAYEEPASTTPEPDDGDGEPEQEDGQTTDEPEVDPDGDPKPDEGDGDPDGETEPDPDEGDGDGDEGDGEQPEEAELDPDAVYLHLDDGTPVTGSELRDGWMRQSDYTRKTQQLSARRKEVEQREQQITEWLQSVKDSPHDAILDMAGATENPVQTFAGALASDGNATSNVAMVLRELANAGQLDKEFVEHFGIEVSDSPVAQRAASAEEQSRIDRLEQREREREQDTQYQQAIQQYEQQWDSIKEQSELDFAEDGQAEQQAKIELMRFARDRKIPDLADAYAVMERRGEGFAGRQAQQKRQRQERARKQAGQAVKKKKAQAQQRGSSGPAASTEPDGPKNLDDVINDTFAAKGITD